MIPQVPTRDDPRTLRPRLQVMVAIVLLVFLGLGGRLCQLQILEGEHYVRRAEQNFIDVVPVEAPRGRIFDTHGETLATNRPAYSLYVTAWVRPRVEVGAGVRAVTSAREAMDDGAADLLESLSGHRMRSAFYPESTCSRACCTLPTMTTAAHSTGACRSCGRMRHVDATRCVCATT